VSDSYALSGTEAFLHPVCLKLIIFVDFLWEFPVVSIDKTLKSSLGLSRSRNVLSRGERIAKLMEEDRWVEGRSPVGLPKVRVQKAVAGKKAKKTKEEDAKK
jgi:small basic protein (TIGR04137 family)